jgi:hypothetical protein
MDAAMSRATFLDALRSGRAEWDDLLIQVPRDLMEEPGVEGDWSIKDIASHIAWHERQMVEVLRVRALVGSNLWELPLDQRNATIFEENRQRSLDDVLTEAGQTFRQLLREVEALSEEDLNDPARFRDMPPDWIPWKLIAENSYQHYPDHVASVVAWLQQ